MAGYLFIDIYYISLQLILLSLTVQGSPLPNYQTYFEGIDPISSSASTSSLSSPSSSLSSSSDLLNQQQQPQPQPQQQQQQQQQQQDHQMSPEPGNMIEFENSYPFPILRGTRNGSASFPSSSSSLSPSSSSSLSSSPTTFQRPPNTIHLLLGRFFKSPEALEGPYQRGRRYRDKSDKSFIRFGRSPNPERTIALWPRENRKRPEKTSDTYFLRFGRSTK
ncbi:putative uncharacterized protein DDB_G0288537 [Panonychus citri]|uniref:putative uncharacterized protein DDB_G0288537 n=1 Tax=Panonychus citri TaxID=50023 RepID=UPI002306E504|nr:putative uncharacterized protein DDB_G0288537 [Panonychus citri]